MNSLVLERTTSSLPNDDHYARNLINGRWQFPAVPYEFEIRNPTDSTITAVVPLSSRFDVAKAFEAASGALTGSWGVPAHRLRLLHTLIDRLDTNRGELAGLQSLETGLAQADSQQALEVTLRLARELLDREVSGPDPAAGAVSGHILSWGLPLTEIVTSVLPSLLRGDAVIVKPSLRGPLTPVAFALLATETDMPAGALNIVQGAGVDVGADLITRRELSSLYVRAGERTIAQAERSHQRTHVPLHILRGGGNVTIVGAEVGRDLDALVESVVAGVRMNSMGGPFGIPLLAVHRDQVDAVIPAVLAGLSTTVAAPLPTEPVRRRSLDRIDALTRAGAEVLLGGADLPDDIAHRMAWRIPPTVLMLGAAGSAAVGAEQASVPFGPVLGVFTWSTWHEVTAAFTSARARDGVATVWGTDRHPPTSLPHGLVAADSSSLGPVSWIGG